MPIQVNTEKTCDNCKKCQEACRQATRNEPSIFLVKTADTIRPALCRQCKKAACVDICSTGALEYVGIMVYLDRDRCIRCGLCELACPFGLIELNAGGVPVKCNLCRHLSIPPCIESCPKGVLELQEVN